MRTLAIAALVLTIGCSKTNHVREDGGVGGIGGGDGGGAADGPLTISPLDVDLGPVAAGATGSALFTVSVDADVTLGAPTLSPATDGFAIDASSTCLNLPTLHAGDSCTLSISFSPMAARTAVSLIVSVPSSLGTVQATISGRAPGSIIEMLTGVAPGAQPPTLNAVFTIDGNIAYAVGSSDGVWRRDGTAWIRVTGPVGDDNATMNGVWAASDDDVYVTTDYGGTTVFHSADRGTTWTSLASLTTNPMSIAGTDANHVYVAGTEGDIAVGSAAATWSLDRTADNVAWRNIANGSGTMLATRYASVWALDSTWTKVIDATNNHLLTAAWGPSRDDLYAVGTDPGCTVNAMCGVIYHSVAGQLPTVKLFRGAFYGIFGSSSGTIYAVGSGGTIATSTVKDAWGEMSPVPSPIVLFGVHGANGHVYVVGNGATIVHIIE